MEAEDFTQMLFYFHQGDAEPWRTISISRLIGDAGCWQRFRRDVKCACKRESALESLYPRQALQNVLGMRPLLLIVVLMAPHRER